MTTSIIHLAVGLVLLVAVNIVLGSLNALFDGSFDKVKLRNGIIKGIIVAACFIAFYMAGYLNPDIIAIEVDEQTVNLMTASNLAKAVENLRQAQLSFREGVATLTNVFEAQTAWLSASSQQIDAQIDLTMARVYLLNATGQLVPSTL